jgi:hypothetical protein
MAEENRSYLYNATLRGSPYESAAFWAHLDLVVRRGQVYLQAGIRGVIAGGLFNKECDR